MKPLFLTAAVIATIGMAMVPAEAQEQPKGPLTTMGDSGTLPTTGAMSGAVPKMNAPATPPAADK
jgi:hypothetical protein